MSAQKFETFIKLMNMTTSSNDAEALVALKKANSILVGIGGDWESLLRGKLALKANQAEQIQNEAPKTSNPKYNTGKSYSGVKYENADEINTMLETLMKRVDPSQGFYDFITSVSDFFNKNGFLTENQYNAIKRNYEKI